MAPQLQALLALSGHVDLDSFAEAHRLSANTVRSWDKRGGLPAARLEEFAAHYGVTARDLERGLVQERATDPPIQRESGATMWQRVQSLHVSESPAPWREGERTDTTQFGGQPIPTGGLAIPASALLRPRGAGAVRPLLLSVPLEGEGGRSRDYELIPKHLRPASAGRGGTSGNGAQEDVVDLVGEMAFSFEWMRQNLSHTTGQVTTIQVRGDSMATTLLDGDTIIIDEGAKHIDVDGIYVLDIAGRRMVKRVQHLFDGTLVLISDNPSYQRETIPRDRARDVKVIGRMVWPRVR